MVDIAPFLKSKLSKRVATWLIALSSLALLTFVIYSPYIPYSITLNEGDEAPYTITAPRFLEFESSADLEKTEKLREKRASLVEPVYTVDEEINKAIIADIVNFFTVMKDYINDKKSTANVQVPEALSFVSNKKLRSYERRFNDRNLSSLEYFTLQNLEDMLKNGIKSVQTQQIQQVLDDNLRILALNRFEKRFIYDLIVQFIRPNLVFDEGSTLAQKQQQINSIQPFTTKFREGEPIIYKGETVDPLHIEILKALNIYGLNANLIKFFGIFACIILLSIIYERFVAMFFKHYHRKLKYYALTYLIALLIVLIGRALQFPNFLPPYFLMEFLIPIPIAAMTLSFLVTPYVSLLCGTIISVFIALMYKADFGLFLFLFLSNAVTAFATYKRQKRMDLIWAGYVVGLCNVFFVAGLGMYNEISDPLWFGANSLLAFINGVISSMVALAVLPYFEGLFKITTQQTLLELSNLNHPLLKRLMVRAPGTYQHSLMVANLAEVAAESIDADVVVSRVGAYFHDIGKMKRPVFFSENQFGDENPHDSLSARMSKLIIASHAKDGVDLATKYKLPEVLKKIMMEHHGTTLVSFFYTQAKQTEEFEDSDSAKEEFRYPGPKPSFKESGIIMFADSVEAAVRAMDKPTLPKIENLIEKIFKDKIEDHQLDDCPLSMSEIKTIKETFLQMFKSIYHSRLDYQEEIDNIIAQTKTE